jgi:hypothetical protein
MAVLEKGIFRNPNSPIASCGDRAPSYTDVLSRYIRIHVGVSFSQGPRETLTCHGRFNKQLAWTGFLVATVPRSVLLPWTVKFRQETTMTSSRGRHPARSCILSRTGRFRTRRIIVIRWRRKATVSPFWRIGRCSGPGI